MSELFELWLILVLTTCEARQLAERTQSSEAQKLAYECKLVTNKMADLIKFIVHRRIKYA